MGRAAADVPAAGRPGYAAITEAGLVNYSGMALQADGGRGFTLALGHKHPPSYPFRLRYAADVERLSKPAAVTGPITTPWRVVMVGADLNALVNSDLVANLSPPPDPKLFPKGAQTDWIKPGRAVWKYLDGGQSTLEGVKEFSRLAGELGFEYQVVEGFWSRWTRRADQGGGRVLPQARRRSLVLAALQELRTPEDREAFFKKLQDFGVVGAKIDFFDHEHKEVVDHYQALLKDAARHRIMVNFHGANKPTGEARTWPNELIREGVRGMEASRLRRAGRHNTTLPFTRFLAGHADYTPVHFGARRGDTTWAHQIATAAVFNEPLLTYGAHPEDAAGEPGRGDDQEHPGDVGRDDRAARLSRSARWRRSPADAAIAGSWRSSTVRRPGRSRCRSRSWRRANMRGSKCGTSRESRTRCASGK